MYLMYVDESGDCGLPSDGSPTRYFCLTGLVVHELHWQDTVDELLSFRRRLKTSYKIYLDDEIHAADMLNKPAKTAKSFHALKKHERLAIIRHFTNKIGTLPNVNLINVVVDKTSAHLADKDAVFRKGWYTLFQRFENTMQLGNFPGRKNPEERGLVFPDRTDGKKLRRYLTTMRIQNKLKIRREGGAFDYIDEPIRAIIEDPVLRDSRESYLVQAADCAVFILKQHIEPSVYMKKQGGHTYLKRLAPILCRHASRTDPLGIVRV